ncbi:MAG: hypothetical protein QOK14_610 [Frankiaceae bacterium]|nr:hypothetical protein [Frankiaceae bacterium]
MGVVTQSPRAVLTRYLVAAALVRTADEGVRVGLVLLALERHAGVALGGALIAGFLAPHILAAPAVGALADHVSRRKALHITAVLFVAAALAACAVGVGRVPGAVAVIIAVAAGCAGPLMTGGMSSLPAIMLPAPMLSRAYAADGATYNTAGVLGPAVAAVVASAISAQASVFALAGCIVAGAAVLATLPIPDGTGTGDGASVANFGRGLAAMWHARTLRVITIASTLSQLGIGALPVIAALLATRYGNAATAGLLLSTFATAGLVGALINAWRPLAPQRPDLVAALSLIGTGIPLFAVPSVHGLGVSAVLFGVAGFLAGPFVGSLLATRQLHAPEVYRTQIFMVAAGLRSAFAALGAALAGALAGMGVGRLVVIAAAIQLGCGLFASSFIAPRRAGAGVGAIPARLDDTAATSGEDAS